MFDKKDKTLCGILNDLKEKISCEEQLRMLDEAINIAKKVDMKLKFYCKQAKHQAQTLVEENWQ